ncbi:hypothetical protein [Streptomyces sp. TE33382]
MTRHQLAERGINAEVTMEERAVHIVLPSLSEACRYTDLVIQNTGPERAAAARLRESFRAVGLTRPGRGARFGMARGCIDIGDLDVGSTLRLWSLIGGGSAVERFREKLDRHALEELARGTRQTLSEVCGAGIGVQANPACATCSSSRPDLISFGSVTPQQANRLARVLLAGDERSAAPCRPFYLTPQKFDQRSLAGGHPAWAGS